MYGFGLKKERARRFMNPKSKIQNGETHGSSHITALAAWL
jgi:hypothetical protein